MIHVDLPAQPLAQALRAFGAFTHLLVMGETEQLDNRTSAALNGDYTHADALRRLLAGTGMTARFVDAQSVVILPATATPPAGQANQFPSPSRALPLAEIDGYMESSAADDTAAYLTLIQQRLTDALCRSPQTRPGNYRLIVQLRISSAGTVAASRVLDSTGDPARDAAIAQTVQDLTLDSAPPTSLPQPINILLRPQDATVANGCASAAPQG